MQAKRPARLSFDFVKEKFAEQHIELLETEYKSNSTPMKCKCLSCGSEFTRRWSHFKYKNTGCSLCGYRRRKQSATHYTQEQVIVLFKEANYELLSPYRVKSDKLKYRCFCGHTSITTLYNFLKGKRCPSCAKRSERNPNWQSDREKIALKKMFAVRCRWLVKNTLNSLGMKKTAKTTELLGYSGDDLRRHFESFSEWDSIKNQNWHIDHIFPVKAFLDHQIYDLKIMNCLQNLQPLLATHNHQKSGKYDVELFKKWLSEVLFA